MVKALATPKPNRLKKAAPQQFEGAAAAAADDGDEDANATGDGLSSFFTPHRERDGYGSSSSSSATSPGSATTEAPAVSSAVPQVAPPRVGDAGVQSSGARCADDTAAGADAAADAGGGGGGGSGGGGGAGGGGGGGNKNQRRGRGTSVRTRTRTSVGRGGVRDGKGKATGGSTKATETYAQWSARKTKERCVHTHAQTGAYACIPIALLCSQC